MFLFYFIFIQINILLYAIIKFLFDTSTSFYLPRGKQKHAYFCLFIMKIKEGFLQSCVLFFLLLQAYNEYTFNSTSTKKKLLKLQRTSTNMFYIYTCTSISVDF